MKKKSISPSKSPSRTPRKITKADMLVGTFSPNSTGASSVPENPYYFCHYRNGMYMGGIKSFQKHGKGIVIHDNGASVISQYYNDVRHGHNIVIYENCLMSNIYLKNKKTEIAMRVPNYLLFLRYISIGAEQVPDGKGLLIDYSNRNIFYLIFRKGKLIDKKSEHQYSVINRVFDLDNTQFLIGSQHASAIKLQTKNDENILIQKSGSKCNFGFHKKGLINGLGVTLSTKDSNLLTSYNPDTHRLSDEFCIQILQRGYFMNSQLSGMGDKWFRNGNMYTGDFKSDIFEGRGVLKNTIKHNWVYGHFQNGNMSELIDYSHEGDLKKYQRIIQVMHQRKNSWMNKQIQVENPITLIKQIQQILNNNPKSKIKTLEEKKKEVLRKIQDNFMCDDPAEGNVQSSRHIKSFNNIGKDSNIQQPKSSDFHGFAGKFLGQQVNLSSPKYHQNSSSRYQQQNTYRSPASSSPNYQTSSSKYRHIPIFQRQNQERPKSISWLKVHEIPTTKQSSQRYRHQSSAYKNNRSPARKLQKSLAQQKNVFRRSPQIYNTTEGKPKSSRMSKNQQKNNHNNSSNEQYNSKYSKISQIKDETPTFNLDSKRIISRSRLFKYLNNQSEEQPPKFSYVPKR